MHVYVFSLAAESGRGRQMEQRQRRCDWRRCDEYVSIKEPMLTSINWRPFQLWYKPLREIRKISFRHILTIRRILTGEQAWKGASNVDIPLAGGGKWSRGSEGVTGGAGTSTPRSKRACFPAIRQREFSRRSRWAYWNFWRDYGIFSGVFWWMREEIEAVFVCVEEAVVFWCSGEDNMIC